MLDVGETVMNKTDTVPVFKKIMSELTELYFLCLLLSGQQQAGLACLISIHEWLALQMAVMASTAALFPYRAVYSHF